MDIQKDVKATGHQIPAFIAGTEMGELYDAMRVRWGGREPFCNAFDASLFYSLGVMHGIRQDRARRKQAAGATTGRHLCDSSRTATAGQ